MREKFHKSMGIQSRMRKERARENLQQAESWSSEMREGRGISGQGTVHAGAGGSCLVDATKLGGCWTPPLCVSISSLNSANRV